MGSMVASCDRGATSGALDNHRTVLMKATRGLISAGDGDQTAAMNRDS